MINSLSLSNVIFLDLQLLKRAKRSEEEWEELEEKVQL